MIGNYIALIVVFLIQESVTSSAVMVQAREAGISWLTIHTIWFICTILSIAIPYYVGKLLFRHKAMEKKMHALRIATLEVLGRHGMALGLILLGLCNFNELNGLLAALLQLRLRYALPLFLTGCTIWYVSIFLTNIISNDYFHTKDGALFNVIMMSLVISIIISVIYSRARGGKKKMKKAARRK